MCMESILFQNKTSPQKAKMNRFTVLESQNRPSTSLNEENLAATPGKEIALVLVWEGERGRAVIGSVRVGSSHRELLYDPNLT